MRLCSFFFFLSESVGCMCVQWTLFDLGFDSPNIARGTQWIHVHVSVCVNACATACVAACKVIHWLRQTKYDIPATHPVHGQLYANTHTRARMHTRTPNACIANTLTHNHTTRGPVCILCAVGRAPEAVCWAHRARLLEMWLASSERGEGRSRRRAVGNWSNRSITQKRFHIADPAGFLNGGDVWLSARVT